MSARSIAAAIRDRKLKSRDHLEAMLDRIERLVLPVREDRAAAEQRRNEKALKADPDARVNRHHENFLRRWWLLSYPRPVREDRAAARSDRTGRGR